MTEMILMMRFRFICTNEVDPWTQGGVSGGGWTKNEKSTPGEWYRPTHVSI